MNWKALGLSILTMSLLIIFVLGLSWVCITYGAGYVLLPIPIIGGTVLFYFIYHDV